MMTTRSARWLVALGATAGLLTGCGAASTPAGPTPPLPAWSWELPECVGYRPADYQAPAHREAVEVRSEPGAVWQVESYQAGWGAPAMAEIRTVLRECASYEAGEPGDPDEFRAQHLVIEAGFAGDESLLVETVHQRPPETEVEYATVVRHGDQVTTVRASQLGPLELRCLTQDDEATCEVGQA